MLMVFELLRWWYGQGWLLAINSIGHRANGLSKSFSVGRLLGTLFAPWRRIVTQSGHTLSSKLQAAGDNLISRMVGFVVRLSVLIVAGVLFLLAIIGGVLETIVWPFVPPAILFCLVRSITG